VNETSRKTRLRLRTGVFFIFLWWIPVWLLSPVISTIFGNGTSAQSHKILVGILIIQTVFFIIGAIICSKTVLKQIRKAPVRKAPKIIWHMFKTGEALPN
jgi:hypothetical protein